MVGGSAKTFLFIIKKKNLFIILSDSYFFQDLVETTQDDGLHLFHGQHPRRKPLLFQTYYPGLQLRRPHKHYDPNSNRQHGHRDAKRHARQISPQRLLQANAPLFTWFTSDSPLLFLFHFRHVSVALCTQQSPSSSGVQLRRKNPGDL